MIEQTEIDGRKATVQYLDDNREPTDDKDKASWLRVVYEDGQTAWLRAAADDDSSGDSAGAIVVAELEKPDRKRYSPLVVKVHKEG